jgi:hypothetical protein
MLIKKEYQVISRKLVAWAKVGILVGYNRAYIYQVYMPLRARDKIVHISHVYFNKGGFVIEPDFKALNDEAV